MSVVQRIKGELRTSLLRVDPSLLTSDSGEFVQILGKENEVHLKLVAAIRGSAEFVEDVLRLPGTDAHPRQMSEATVPWLFHRDELISFDAQLEMQRLRFDSFREHRELLPVETARPWLTRDAAAADGQRQFQDQCFLDLIAEMIAAVGNPGDVPLVERLVFEGNPENTIRPGMESLRFADLFLAGESALQQLTCECLNSDQMAFSDRYARLVAIRRRCTDGEPRLPDQGSQNRIAAVPAKSRTVQEQPGGDGEEEFGTAQVPDFPF